MPIRSNVRKKDGISMRMREGTEKRCEH